MKRIPRHIKFWLFGVPILVVLFAGSYIGAEWLSNRDSAEAAGGGVITVKGHNVTQRETISTPAHTITRDGKTIHVPASTQVRVTTHFEPGHTTILPAQTVTHDGTKTVVRTIPGPAGPTTTVVRTVTAPGGTTTIVQTVTGPTVTVPVTQTVPGPTTTETIISTVTVSAPPIS